MFLIRSNCCIKFGINWITSRKGFIYYTVYNWEGIRYPSKLDDWKRFENNNPTIALNILYTKEKEICNKKYISKHNSTREKQIILLMIPNKRKEGWHCLAVKTLSALLRGITLKHHGNFYWLNFSHSFRTENELKSHQKVCKKYRFLWNCNGFRKV